ncbi:unnamed protein product, partial [Didymodactylos carnosus]
NALNWYNRNASLINSWQQFVTFIKDEFGSKYKEQEAFERMKNYHQSINHSVIEFYNGIMDISREINPSPTDHNILQHLISNVKPSLKITILEKQPKNTIDFLNYAKMYEQLAQMVKNEPAIAEVAARSEQNSYYVPPHRRLDNGEQPQRYNVNNNGNSSTNAPSSTLITTTKKLNQLRGTDNNSSRLTDTIKIPAQVETSIRVSAALSTGRTLFRPSYNCKEQMPIIMSNNLLEIKDHQGFVNIYNPSNYPCVLTKEENKKLTPEKHIENLVKSISKQNEREKFRKVLLQFKHLFDTSGMSVAKTEVVHAINTQPHAPPSSKFYPLTAEKEKAMFQISQELLDSGLITKAKSEYASPALLMPKSDGSRRLVIDYKKLNNITIKDQYPLPNMEQTIQRLGEGYQFFTNIDLKSGFWQIPIRRDDRRKTAFITPFGLYMFNVLPQGLKNSPPTFQRVMNTVLEPCRDYCQVYLDDIVIPSKSMEDHLLHVQQVLEKLNISNLKLNPPKCSLAQSQINYLRHTITATTITPLNEKINAILNLKEPRTLKEANRFIGGIAWYRKYKFKWGHEQSLAFHKLKTMLTTEPLILKYPVDTKPLMLSTDASKIGIGGVLYQEIEGERFHLYYHSQLISKSQQHYDTIEKEALAIYKCFKRMRNYLLGREIIIFTDHCPLCHMMEKSIKNKRVDRIALLLQEYNIIQVIHVKGRHNCLPDYMSRNPVYDKDELMETDYGLQVDLSNRRMPGVVAGVTTRSMSK